MKTKILLLFTVVTLLTACSEIETLTLGELPVATNDVATVLEDSTTNGIAVLINDSFGGGGPSTEAITITTEPTNGTASVNDGETPTDPTDDTIDYTPTADYSGPDSVTYQICDADGNCDTALVSITVSSLEEDKDLQ